MYALADELPLYPLARLKLVLEQVILVGEIRVRMYIAGVSAEYEHRGVMDDCGVMIARSWRHAGGYGSSPRLLLRVEAQQVVQHFFSVVSAEHVYSVLIGHYGMLAAPANKSEKIILKTMIKQLALSMQFTNPLMFVTTNKNFTWHRQIRRTLACAATDGLFRTDQSRVSDTP